MVANLAYSLLDMALASRVKVSTVECTVDLHDLYGVPPVRFNKELWLVQVGLLCLCRTA